MSVISQYEKNQVISVLEKWLEGIENELLMIGNTGTERNRKHNEVLLAEYAKIERFISRIQFHY